jgi:phosphopantetheinyl transferase
MAAGRPVRWSESETGPRVLESLGRGRIGVSLSYGRSEAWLALGWEGPIGLDAVTIEPVPDWEEVASVYLEPVARERLRKSTRPDLDFSKEWAGFEARLKLGGLSLSEGITPPPALLLEATFDKVAVAVALNLDANPGITGVEPPPGGAQCAGRFAP